MSLKIYNSLTKRKEEFKPLNEGEVKMYVCGPTVYDEPHIGHLRSAYVFEMIRNYLEYSDYKVTFVRNVTDVDDKIIEKAKESNSQDLIEEVKNVSKKYYDLYKKELQTFALKDPTKEPKATGHIGEMIQLIQRLVEKGFAYVAQGNVYFSVDNFIGYGKLSGQKKEAMLEGTRAEPGENKKAALDFALWKKAKEGEPAWDSPWGKGRPGWHLECSAMSMKYLGESFDIHGGGLDLVFPHHENEIAQSEAATGKPFVKVWIHHGLVTHDGRKMSKSLHNYATLGELATKGSAAIEELKFLFLGTHYRMPVDYSEEKMKMEKNIRNRFLNYIMEAESFKTYSITQPDLEIGHFEQEFINSMNDDFNTSQALSILHEMISYARKEDSISTRLSAKKVLLRLTAMLGLNFNDAYPNPEQLKVSKEVNALIAKRYEAKNNKDYKLADEIRIEVLNKYNLVLVDEKDGTTHWVHKDFVKTK